MVAACVWALHANRAALAELGRGDGSVDSGALKRLDVTAGKKQRFERVAVFGDSLTMCVDPDTRRFDSLGRHLNLQINAAGRPVEVVDLSQVGLWPLFYYALLDEALALPSSVVVVEVNLRTFMDPLARPGEERLPGLARKLDFTASLQVTESLEREGLSVLDPPMMRLKEQLGLLYVLEGAREAGLGLLTDAGESIRTTLGLPRRWSPPLMEVVRRAALTYAVDYTDNPNAKVLRAIVTALRQAQVPFLLYVAPINVDYIQSTPELAAPDLAQRIEALRGYVGASKVEWIDLHDTLPASMFRDFQNHLRVQGCVRLARPIAQRVLHLLAHRNRRVPQAATAPATPPRE